MPEVTACINDIEGNYKLGLELVYYAEDVRLFYDAIDIKPDTELKVNLNIDSPGHLQPNSMFYWDDIPIRNNAFIKSLKTEFGIDWAKDASIEKIDENRTIVLSGEYNHLSLSLNNEKTKAFLKIDDDRTYELFVIGGNVYKPVEYEKFDEIIIFKTIGMNNYSYCNNAKDEEVLTTEKIKILK